MNEAGRALATEVVERLVAARMTVALAESCTGGMVAALLTDVPGSSQCLWGGAVVYAPDAKVALTGIAPRILEEFGTVSETTTGALAAAIRERSGADLGLAVTGWAGPAAGVEPPGTVYIAVDRASGCHCVRAVYDGDRAAVRTRAAHAALQQLVDAASAVPSANGLEETGC